MRNFGRLAMDDMYLPGLLPAQKTESWLSGRHLGFFNMLTIVGNVRHVPVGPVMQRDIAPYYPECAAGDCTLCRHLDVPHYSFHEGRTFWWTGPIPVP
jgi:hypothetical protein